MQFIYLEGTYILRRLTWISSHLHTLTLISIIITSVSFLLIWGWAIIFRAKRCRLLLKCTRWIIKSLWTTETLEGIIFIKFDQESSQESEGLWFKKGEQALLRNRIKGEWKGVMSGVLQVDMEVLLPHREASLEPELREHSSVGGVSAWQEGHVDGERWSETWNLGKWESSSLFFLGPEASFT